VSVGESSSKLIVYQDKEYPPCALTSLYENFIIFSTMAAYKLKKKKEVDS
jgi:hypothetical protein